MGNIIAREFAWAAPLLVRAQRVPSLPVSEAHSERIISQVRRILGRHAIRASDEKFLNRTRMNCVLQHPAFQDRDPPAFVILG
jgi:hypothetical protein